MSTEFTIGEHTYRAGRLDARTQFHVVRRLGPVLADLTTASTGNVIANIAVAVGKLKDEDADYVIDKSLRVVTRAQDNGRGWAAVSNPTGGLMFDDIDMPVMLQLVWKVLEEYLVPFFKGSLS